MSVLRSLALRLAAGALVVGLVAVAVRRPDPPHHEVTAVFDRAGLNVREGDEVRVRGVPVGRIAAIEVDRTTFTATYRLRLDPDVAIAADTSARLVPKTFFGDKFVALDPASAGEPRLADGAVIGLDRTTAPTEVGDVLDRVGPTLEAIDPVALSATLASLATGFDGAGADVGRILDGGAAVGAELAARHVELARLLEAVPGVAGTVAEQADSLVAASDAFAELADLVVAEEHDLARFLTATGDLAGRAGELLATERGRIQDVVENGASVLDILADRPGALTALLDGAPRFVNGLAAATGSGAFRAPIANFMVLNPGSVPDASGEFGEAQGGAGIGPDIVVKGLDLPEATVDAADPAAATSTTQRSLSALLGSLLGAQR